MKKKLSLGQANISMINIYIVDSKNAKKINKMYVVSTQKSCLIEMVLLSTTTIVISVGKENIFYSTPQNFVAVISLVIATFHV